MAIGQQSVKIENFSERIREVDSREVEKALHPENYIGVSRYSLH